MSLALSRFTGTAFHGVAGVRPLWRTPNWHAGRFGRGVHGAGEPVQYLALHPMGPMAELLRREPLARERPDAVTLNVFALRLDIDGVLDVDFDTAPSLGLEPAALVRDDWRACQEWVTALRREHPEVRALRTPSAALPGTRNLVVFGPRTPIGYDDVPRRERFLPCALVACAAAAHDLLPPAVRAIGERRTHAELAAWRRGRPFRMVQPDPR